ncbi:MAG: OmpA family protein [Paludibacteraceae bacterium]|nr:OmpA family protein [Paludibacteraceae bacterium]
MKKTCLAFIVLGLLLTIIPFATLSAQKKKTVRPKREKYDKGHFIGLYLNGGVGSLGYRLEGGKAYLQPSFGVQAEYAYFFNPYIGIQTGLQFSYYSSRAALTDDMFWNNLTDYQNQQYNHRIEFDSWRETQRLLELGIPIGIAFKYKPKKFGLYGDLGLRVNALLNAEYNHNKGSLTHTAYYPFWDVTMHDLPNRYETETYTQKDRIEDLSLINVAGYFDIGMLIQVNKRVDLTVGLYADYTLNDMVKTKKSNRPELGFARSENNYGSFMNTYNGLVGTNHVSSVHLWSAGLKLGIRIAPKLTEREKQRKAQRQYRKIKKYLPETQGKIDTVYIETILHDTVLFCPATTEDSAVVVRKRQTERAHENIHKMLQASVIWFHYDDYKPILEPAYILDSVAFTLRQYPNLRVAVNGHACSMGSDSYNQRLALRRAQAVADMLQKKGVQKRQLIVNSYGATEPFHYSGKHQQAYDRRVEIVPMPYEEDTTIQVVALNETWQKNYGKLYTEFLGEEKITEGVTLRTLAEKWYKEPAYWVYIYEANSDRLVSATDIPSGTVVMIPDLKDVLRDLTPKQALRQAKYLEKEYEKSER